MKMRVDGDTLIVSEVSELGAANSNGFRDWVRSGLNEQQKNVEVDLSGTDFIDSCGLGALIAIHKTATSRRGKVRLLRPRPQVNQILELTRMQHIFDIVKT
jgi:anti-sigma B factor antagonist